MSDGEPPEAHDHRGVVQRRRLPRHIKLRHDAARDRWIILAPERVFEPDAIAVAVLELCDGVRTVERDRRRAGTDLQRAEGASWPTSAPCCRGSPTRAW